MNKDIAQRALYASLTQYGSVFPLTLHFRRARQYVEWTEDNFNYSQYNPRKPNNRYGLSLTSLDGGTSGGPDLDSIPEYNRENGTDYRERDFSVITPAYSKELQEVLQPFNPFLFRTHVLKLGPGGFFPPHRDQISELRSFRLIIPLKNTSPPSCMFVVDGEIKQWQEGRVYFVDTVKEHTLVNASYQNSYWLVANVDLTIESFDTFINYIPY